MPQVAKVWYNNASCSLFWTTFSAHVATLQSVQTSQRGYLHFNVCSSNNSNNSNNSGIITQKVAVSVQQCSIESWKIPPFSVEWGLLVLVWWMGWLVFLLIG